MRSERWREDFDLFVSEVVVREAKGGDPEAASRRTELIAHLPLLELSDHVTRLAAALIKKDAVPLQSSADAVHIAVAAVHGVDYLLTWNMAHILNAERRPLIERVCRAEGLEPPVLCTPAELMGGPDVA